jgi:RNA polymerase sigma-70 factor (ECF subfamily)
VDEGRPRFEASRKQHDELVERFFAAAERGDLTALEQMLAADVVVYGDGGGKAPSWPKPISGRERVAKLIAGTVKQANELGVRRRAAHVNGQPGVMFLDDEDRIGAVISIDVADGLVQTIHGVTNPDKLAHLGPVLDAREALRKARG